ncbi:MAG TPA: cell division protein ZapA [Pyrinomonadaceae bacterium]|nr:cell division protein ZapA [Pyrinomonadaceae bacterium]
MSQRETGAGAPVRVTIFNQTYSLRSASGAEHVRAVARAVDERMQHIASQLAVHDVAKVAVLTALNIADELQSLRDYYEKEIMTLFPPRPESAPAEDDEGAAATTPQQQLTEARPEWFDALFEHDDSKAADRMSSQISSRLQRLRQARQGESIVEGDE